MNVKEMLNRIDYRSFFPKHIPGFEANGKTEVQCLCPIHDDKSPSLSVNVEKGIFNCFGCGKKGDAVTFLQLCCGLDRKSAIKKIREEARVKSEGQNPKPVPEGGDRGSKTQTPKSAYLTFNQVKLIHNQLLKNEAALKTFQDKYGLSPETKEKYLFGYQNEHYVIPFEIKPGEWTFKEHKGKQSKGAKATLYPPEIIKEDLPYIIIGEGEFKSLLLNQHGFPSVSGTAGAGTWKREWNSFFQGLNVILAYDNDEAGREGIQRVINNLKGFAKSVRVIEWPSSMDSKDKKDVTDFFVAPGKTKEDFQRLIDSAKEIAYAIKEIDGIRFIEPEGFEVKEERVIQISYYGNTSVKKPAFYTPLFIVGRAIDVDLGLEDVKIAFKRDGKWKYTWISKRIISDSKKILELSDHGLPVNRRNAGKMVEYLATFEAFNMNIIPRTYISKGVGRKSIEGKQVLFSIKWCRFRKTNFFRTARISPLNFFRNRALNGLLKR